MIFVVVYFAPGDLEPTPAIASVPTVASSSFYLVDTEDTSSAVSAAGSIVTQPTSDETSNVTEAKANGNESFYFVDEDKTISATADNSEETSVSVPAEVPEDTEPEEEQHQQDEEMEDKTETAVKVEFIEALPPVVPLTHSTPGEPSSLLTSVRLVIGVLNLISFHRLLVINERTLLLSVCVRSFLTAHQHILWSIHCREVVE